MVSENVEFKEVLAALSIVQSYYSTALGLWFKWCLAKIYSDTDDFRTDRAPRREIDSAISARPPLERPGRLDSDQIVFDHIEETEGGDGGCALCMEKYKDGDYCGTITECNHRFHGPCIIMWLAKNESFPLCRSFVV